MSLRRVIGFVFLALAIGFDVASLARRGPSFPVLGSAMLVIGIALVVSDRKRGRLS